MKNIHRIIRKKNKNDNLLDFIKIEKKKIYDLKGKNKENYKNNVVSKKIINISKYLREIDPRGAA